jgi:hypothetical protein
MEYRIPYDVILKAREFAKKVYAEKEVVRGFKNSMIQFIDSKKGLQGEGTRIGFEAEFAFCYVFDLPFPELFSGSEVDEFDAELCLGSSDGFKKMRLDLKNSKKCLINKAQFDRKDIDGYVFCFLNFLDFKQDLIFLKVFGWIEKKDVVANSELVSFANGSQAYKVNKKALKKLIVKMKVEKKVSK